MGNQGWKRVERELAAIMGGKRLPSNGSAQPDVVVEGMFSVESKARQSMPDWFIDAVEQARRSAFAGTVPVTVFQWHRPGIKTRRFFVLDERSWAELHGPVGDR